MSYRREYLDSEPARGEVDQTVGLTLLEFGAPGCGFCAAIQPALSKALEGTDVQHLKIEDGSGRLLGRSFHVKLWPTLILLRDGKEEGRAVRPTGLAELESLLRREG